MGGVAVAGLFFADEFDNGIAVEAFGEAVGAEKKRITGFVADGADLRIYKLIGAAQRFLQDVTLRMRASFPLLEFAIAIEPADVSIVFADLFDRSGVFGKIIKASVADMGEEHPFGREPCERQGGFHAVRLFVTAAHEDEGFVNL